MHESVACEICDAFLRHFDELRKRLKEFVKLSKSENLERKVLIVFYI